MGRIKTGMLVGAALRLASAELIDCVVVNRGDADAGALFVHIDALDGRHKLLSRVIGFEGAYEWRSVLGDDADGWTDAAAVAQRLARERDIDPDIWIIAIADRAGRNPFAML